MSHPLNNNVSLRNHDQNSPSQNESSPSSVKKEGRSWTSTIFTYNNIAAVGAIGLAVLLAVGAKNYFSNSESTFVPPVGDNVTSTLANNVTTIKDNVTSAFNVTASTLVNASLVNNTANVSLSSEIPSLIQNDRSKLSSINSEFCEISLPSGQASVNTDQNEVNTHLSKIEELTKSIERKQDRMNDLQTGVEELTIFEFAPRPEDTIRYCEPNSIFNHRFIPHDRYRRLNVKDVDCPEDSQEKIALAKDIDGQLYVSTTLDADYCIEKPCKQRSNHWIYQGPIEKKGNNWELVETMRHPGISGDKMTYSFETTWKKGSVIPSINITNTVRKVDLHRASLDNLHSDIIGLKEEKSKVEERLKYSNVWLNISKSNLERIEKICKTT